MKPLSHEMIDKLDMIERKLILAHNTRLIREKHRHALKSILQQAKRFDTKMPIAYNASVSERILPTSRN